MTDCKDVSNQKLLKELNELLAKYEITIYDAIKIYEINQKNKQDD